MDITALEVALLYKNRWSVELLFKWLKQHLKIKKFWGDSENAVRIQIYTAIISYCLVAIVHHQMKLDRTIYETLQILGISLIDTTSPFDGIYNTICITKIIDWETHYLAFKDVKITLEDVIWYLPSIEELKYLTDKETLDAVNSGLISRRADPIFSPYLGGKYIGHPVRHRKKTQSKLYNLA